MSKRTYKEWSTTIGDNFIQDSLTDNMMHVKNMQTQGGYQAEVSGMYGEFTVAAAFKALPDCYAVINDILLQTGIQYRRYTLQDLQKYGVTPWNLCTKSGKVIQQIDKQSALNILQSAPGVYYYEQVKMSTQLDHIIVSPYGIFVIETKNHKGMIFGDLNGKVWTQTFGPEHHTFYNPVLQNAQHLKYLSKQIQLPANVMTGLIVFTNPVVDLTNVACPFCLRPDTLAEIIFSFTNQIWSDKETEAVIHRIEKIDTNNYSLSKEHVTFVKDLQHRAEVNKQYCRR